MTDLLKAITENGWTIWQLAEQELIRRGLDCDEILKTPLPHVAPPIRSCTKKTKEQILQDKKNQKRKEQLPNFIRMFSYDPVKKEQLIKEYRSLGGKYEED